MVHYKISYGNGSAWLSEKIITVDEETTDYGSLIDILIDKLEKNGEEHFFLKPEEIDKYSEDMYVVGGNHGRYLYHNGYLNIQKADNKEVFSEKVENAIMHLFETYTNLYSVRDPMELIDIFNNNLGKYLLFANLYTGDHRYFNLENLNKKSNKLKECEKMLSEKEWDVYYITPTRFSVIKYGIPVDLRKRYLMVSQQYWSNHLYDNLGGYFIKIPESVVNELHGLTMEEKREQLYELLTPDAEWLHKEEMEE